MTGSPPVTPPPVLDGRGSVRVTLRCSPALLASRSVPVPRHRVAAVEEIAAGTGRELTVGDRIVAVFRIGDDFYAMDGICPHAGGPLGKGYVSGKRVTCPWHGWQFDVTTGVHCLTPAIRHETFPVVVEDGAVYVELP